MSTLFKFSLSKLTLSRSLLSRSALGVLVLLVAVPFAAARIAHAQAPAAPVVAPDFVPLPEDKQERIREFARGQDGVPTPAVAADLVAGETVPVSVPLRGLPRDMVTELSKVTSYRFVVLDKTIAIVEPASRTVVQVIRR